MTEHTSDHSVSIQDENQVSPRDSDIGNKSESSSRVVLRSHSLLTLTALFVALVVAGFGLWVWLKTYRDISTVKDNTLRLNKRVEELNLEPKLSKIMDKLEMEIMILSKGLSEKSEIIESLQQSVDKLYAEAAQTPTEWTIARSLHLAELANYRLQFLRDVDTATVALQAAYHALEQSADPSLLYVRKAISADLAKLRSFKQPDLNIIEEKLDRMLKEHKYMPLVKPDTSNGDHNLLEKTDHDLNEEQVSENMLYALLKEINKHLIVKRHDKPIEALPAQQSQIYYYQILHLKLESIRLAVLQKDNEEYQQQINSTLDWIDSHYTPSSLKAIQEELEKLVTINIAPPLPAINNSIEALRAVLDTETFHVKERAME